MSLEISFGGLSMEGGGEFSCPRRQFNCCPEECNCTPMFLCWILFVVAIVVVIALGATGHFIKLESREGVVTQPPTVAFDPEPVPNLSRMMGVDIEFEPFEELEEWQAAGQHDQRTRAFEKVVRLRLECETDGN